MKAKMHVFSKSVVNKEINSKRNPGEKIVIPEQQVAIQLDGDRFPKEGVIGLPRSRNGQGFDPGIYELPVVLHTNNFGGFDLSLDLSNAKLVPAATVSTAQRAA